jgi:hypothetical protein
MNPNLDRKAERALLDAVLRDEEWEAANTPLRAGTLAAFRRRQRQRRLTRVFAGLLVLTAAIGAACHWRGRGVATPSQVASSRTVAPKTPSQPRYLSDAELLALFPKGSCVLAEVDGRKELVFLDAKAEQIYLVRTGPRPEGTSENSPTLQRWDRR